MCIRFYIFLLILFNAAHPSLAQQPASRAKIFQPGTTFSDCNDCPKMIVVPRGTFTMGSPGSEPERDVDEAQVKVSIAHSFAVGKFEVTFAEWDACFAAGGCKHKPEDQGWGRGKRPVVNVSWNDITEQYLPWLSRKTSKTYRLLSDEEWEYAARAGTATPFWWGKSITPRQANYDGNYVYKGGGSQGKFRKRTTSVDSFDANPWGLYNMHGNVWEWTEDCWNKRIKGSLGDGTARKAGDCDRRVLRGGSWNDFPRSLRSASRGRNRADFRLNVLGFRVARMLTP
jgi:formylglycine-generating enzyme required for sulfatase activity